MAAALRAAVGTTIALLGAVGGAVVVSVVTTNGAHEVITAAVGDTLTPRFSVKTDSIVRVVGNNVIVSRCGASRIFLRLYRPNLKTQLAADTVDITVPCPVVNQDTVVASMTMYNRFLTDTGGKVFGAWDASMVVGTSRCVFVVQVNPLGKALTGRHVTLSSSDTTVAKVGVATVYSMPRGMNQPLTCPDTTIDPAAIVWGVKPALGVRAT